MEKQSETQESNDERFREQAKWLVALETLHEIKCTEIGAMVTEGLL